MRFINRGRQTGKTMIMIHSSYATGYPIIVTNNNRKGMIKKQAEEIGCGDILVYTVNEWNRIKMTSKNDNIFVDETEEILKEILNEYLNANVVAATLSLPMVELNQDKLQ